MSDNVKCSECGKSVSGENAHVRLTGAMRIRHSTADPVIVDHLVFLCDECLELKKYSDCELAREDWNDVYRVGGAK